MGVREHGRGASAYALRMQEREAAVPLWCDWCWDEPYGATGRAADVAHIDALLESIESDYPEDGARGPRPS